MALVLESFKENPIEMDTILEPSVTCPRCGAESINKSGKTSYGKQRYKCLVCDRQFVAGARKVHQNGRPSCPICGKHMHVYMTNTAFNRFRCSDYPRCRGFVKKVKRQAVRV